MAKRVAQISREAISAWRCRRSASFRPTAADFRRDGQSIEGTGPSRQLAVWGQCLFSPGLRSVPFQRAKSGMPSGFR